MKYTDPNFNNPYTSKLTKGDIGETNINHFFGEDFCRIESTETYWKDKIIELEKEFPDRVVITKEYRDTEGNLEQIVALMPYSDMKKIKPSKVKTMSDEEREEKRKRAKEMIASGKMGKKKREG